MKTTQRVDWAVLSKEPREKLDALTNKTRGYPAFDEVGPKLRQAVEVYECVTRSPRAEEAKSGNTR